MSYSWLEHTADTRLRIESGSREELFSDALGAMNELLAPEQQKPPVFQQCSICLTASDTTALLVDFLNAVLLETTLRKTVFNQVSFRKITEKELSAILKGRRFRKLARDIKAVTYHEADVRINNKGNLETVLVFDL
jgi:SHS2 domain-containing protein